MVFSPLEFISGDFFNRTSIMSDPLIIQGGMGVAVSGWPLANAVSRLGQLGVVSGTILAVVLARRLQQGDEGGHMRWALDQFPIQAMATRILERYFVPGGKEDTASFAPVPMPTASYSPELTELTVVANFVEVALAKKGHDGVVGINLLEKVAFPTLASLFGAMLAGVDYVLMGAGIPRLIPGVLDRFARGESAELDIPVACAPSQLSGNGAVSSGEPTGASAIAAALAAEMPTPGGASGVQSCGVHGRRGACVEASEVSGDCEFGSAGHDAGTQGHGARGRFCHRGRYGWRTQCAAAR